MMAIWKIGPALAAGNTIVLKPARDDAAHDAAARRAGRRASCPPGVLNVVGGHGDPTGQRARHPPRRRHGLADRLGRDRQVDRRARGRHAQARAPRARRQGAGDRLRRRRPRDARWRRSPATGYYNAGQDCTAATRVLAVGKVYDDVVAGLAEQAKGYVIGDTMAADTTLGPGQLGAPARARRGLPRAQARPRRGRHRRRASPTGPASSSSRPSSPASSRTTR